MKKYNLKKCVLMALSVSGGVIGAGFASGAEVVSFFAKYGWVSLLLCLIAGLFFAYLSYIIISVNNAYKNNHKKEKRKNIKEKLKKHSEIGFLCKKSNTTVVFGVVLFICQMVIAGAMIAGMDRILNLFIREFRFVCLFKYFLLFLCFVFVMNYKKGVLLINSTLVVVLLVCGLFLFVYNIGQSLFIYQGCVKFSVVYMPFLYVGMNIFTVYSLVCDLGENMSNKKEVFLACFLIFLTITIPLILICLTILLFGGCSVNEMIMVDIASKVSLCFGLFYSLLVLFGLVTTFLTTLSSMSQLLSKKFCYNYSVIICFLSSLVLSFIGFRFLVDLIYPIVGFVCLISMCVYVVDKKRKINTKRY